MSIGNGELAQTDDFDPAAELRDLLETLVEAMDLTAEVRIVEAEGLLTGTLDGAELGRFIGRHGQTIEAVQHLAQRIVLRGGAGGPRVVVDAAGYRERREGALRAQAEDAAATTERTGDPVELEPMSAAERRFVHEFLRERGGVETHSEGDEPERRLVVTAFAAGRASS
ncbi:MAG: spoIIIJ-associated protein [Solirubrobacteraceae bacterium]|jgi:spoIIIJ-associated protein|nr:spoIIIJ-associated protein [Solirubrobacteraceae bacterium]